MVTPPTDAELGAAYATGRQLQELGPDVGYAELLDYLAWVCALFERLSVASPSRVTRREARRELYLLRYMQRQIACGADADARRVVRGFDAEARREALRAGECRG